MCKRAEETYSRVKRRKASIGTYSVHSRSSRAADEEYHSDGFVHGSDEGGHGSDEGTGHGSDNDGTIATQENLPPAILM